MDGSFIVMLSYLAIGAGYAFKRGITFETHNESYVVNMLFWLPKLFINQKTKG